MKKITIKSLLIIALAIIPMAVFAQNNDEEQPAKPNNNHYWSVGFDEGATLLFGDNKSWDFQNVRPEIGVFGGFTFAKHSQVQQRFQISNHFLPGSTTGIPSISSIGCICKIALD